MAFTLHVDPSVNRSQFIDEETEVQNFHNLAKNEKVNVLLSCVRLFGTPWTVAHQAPLSMGFSWQEYWSGYLFPSPRDLSKPGIELASLALQSEPQGSFP